MVPVSLMSPDDFRVVVRSAAAVLLLRLNFLFLPFSIPRRNSHPGSPSTGSKLSPHYGTVRGFIFIARRLHSAILPSSTRIE